jgi:hypothetical protein
MFSFLFGCSFFNSSSDYEKIADKITEKTAEKLQVEKHLCLIGTGGQMMDDIQMMAMSFNYYQEVEIEKARMLIVYAVHDYLLEINNNNKIRPYLHNYPFNSKNVEIRIFVYNSDRSELPPEKIYCIECINGKIEYYTRLNPRQAIHEESYEEASKKTVTSQNVAKQIGPIIDENYKKKNIFREAIAKDGAKVNVTVDSFEHSMFKIRGEDFKPYEALNFISNSCNEVLCFSIQADKSGNIPEMGFLPAVIGKSGGICYIDILRDKDAIHIRFPWGIECKIENN